MSKPELSVVIPTKNEEANVATCIRAFDAVRARVEIVVVDNFSTDRTLEIATALGARVFTQGPERCAQRNRGWHEATGAVILFVDADMILPLATTEEILSIYVSAPSPIPHPSPFPSLYIPEQRRGHGLRLRARNFERSFYDGTCIDGLRVIPRAWLETVGGYDESLVACEDWDLDRRLLTAGTPTAVTKGHLIHNEANQGLTRLLAKKAYYAKSVDAYRRKWRNDAICRRQFGLCYRFFGVFVENGKWKRLLRHPLLAIVMYVERFLVGITYILHRGTASCPIQPGSRGCSPPSRTPTSSRPNPSPTPCVRRLPPSPATSPSSE